MLVSYITDPEADNNIEITCSTLSIMLVPTCPLNILYLFCFSLLKFYILPYVAKFSSLLVDTVKRIR